MRIFAVSDLHVDYPENLVWIMSLPALEYTDDLLIVAGDVSDDLELLARVLSSLRSKFRQVMFVPGNHELWVDRDGLDCSLEKFHAVMALCVEHGISSELSHFGDVSIVPLLSWYDYSFGEPDSYLRRAWRDFRACSWPAALHNAAAVSAFFLEKNEQYLGTKNKTVISFSHFLPRIDLMPARIPQQRRRVYPVLGSSKLGEQIKQLNPDIHVYGHSHVNRSVTLDQVHYLNNAFAYPREQHISRKQLHCVFEDTV